MPFKAALNQQRRCSKEELSTRQKPQGRVGLGAAGAGLSPLRLGWELGSSESPGRDLFLFLIKVLLTGIYFWAELLQEKIK